MIAMVARLLVVLLSLAPVGFHLAEREFADAWVIIALFCAPALLARRDASKLLCWTVGLYFLVPLLPSVLRILPFVSERVVLLGAIAWCAAADLWPRGGDSGPIPRAGRWVLALWLGWSVAAALRGFWLALPEGSGWFLPSLREVPAHVLALRSPVEPAHAFAALWTRLELLLPAWFALRVAAVDRALPRRLAVALGWAFVFGVGMMLLDFWTGIQIRGDDFVARLRGGIPRNHRPLADNNALGSATVIGLPLVLGAAATAFLDRRPRSGVWRYLPAVAAGVLLLVTTRSKAAIGAFAMALPLLLLVRMGVRNVLRRPLPAIGLAAGVLLLIGAQLLPQSAVERLQSTRVGSDAIRVLRLDVATDYLQDNRMGPWVAARNAFEAAPIFGHGLGSLPLRMAEHRDPEVQTWFNPLHENGHNQWLQALAEEGIGGGLALTLLFGSAALGVLGRLRAAREEPEGDAWILAGLVAAVTTLAINLQVGHSLLEPSVAVLTGAVLGVGIGCGAWSGSSLANPSRVPRLVAAAAAALLVGLVPLAYRDRVPLEGASRGAYPWIERDDPVFDRDRLLSPDARWFQRWGDGDRMLVVMLDPRPFLFAEPLRVTVDVDGETMLEGFPLARPDEWYADLPSTLVKVDKPEHVRPGDLVEVRVRTAPVFSEMFYASSGRDWIGPRIGDGTFLYRRN